MYSLRDLQNEICAKIKWLQENNGAVLHPDWITQAVMKDHAEIEGADADFHLCISRLYVRKEVTQQLNKTDAIPKLDEPQQLTLEGYEYVQKYYVIKRGDDLVSVRVDALTYEEGKKKAMSYIRLGAQCNAHGEELLRYIEGRRATA